MRIGYAHVGSDTQDYTAQVEALRAAGCSRLFSEKVSGKSMSGRPKLAKLLKALAPGDVMVVTKIDRGARSALDLLHIVRTEIAGRQCGFVSLGDSWCDTTNEMGRFMLTVMSGIAELERDLIRKRCAAGIARAKANGKRFGRPVLDVAQRRKIAEHYANGETIAALAREYECGKATVWRCLSPREGRPAIISREPSVGSPFI